MQEKLNEYTRFKKKRLESALKYMNKAEELLAFNLTQIQSQQEIESRIKQGENSGTDYISDFDYSKYIDNSYTEKEIKGILEKWPELYAYVLLKTRLKLPPEFFKECFDKAINPFLTITRNRQPKPIYSKENAIQIFLNYYPNSDCKTVKNQISHEEWEKALSKQIPDTRNEILNRLGPIPINPNINEASKGLDEHEINEKYFLLPKSNSQSNAVFFNTPKVESAPEIKQTHSVNETETETETETDKNAVLLSTFTGSK